MGKALYRKYRSSNLDEIIGQEHITTTLANAIKRGKLSHAYLLTGPRGVGKTSIARILAHQVNGFDYTGEDNYLDIIEIDAASNRGIEEIRDLREKVAVAPAQGKYKVYIIDEVHMLTTPAFNALLKTLEEPPAHVIFILATTEAHKLPATIVSRTQRHNFRPVATDKVVKHLTHIAKQEKIDIEPAALELIAQHGEGSFRDSISLLDQAAGQAGKITLADINQLLGVPPQDSIDNLLTYLTTGQAGQLVQQLAAMYEQGHRPAAIAKLLAGELRQQLLASKPILPVERQLDLLQNLLEVPSAFNPAGLLEITLLKTALSGQTMPVAQPVKPATPQTPAQKSKPAHKPDSTEQPSKGDTDEIKSAKHQAAAAAPSVKQAAEAPSEDQAIDAVIEPANPKPAINSDLDIKQVWPELLKNIKVEHNTLYGILRMSSPALDGEELVLTFAYSFHSKRMSEPKYQQVILDALQQITGQNLRLRCEVGPSKPQPLVEEVIEAPPEAPIEDIKPAANPDLANISNIFGGAELL